MTSEESADVSSQNADTLVGFHLAAAAGRVVAARQATGELISGESVWSDRVG